MLTKNHYIFNIDIKSHERNSTVAGLDIPLYQPTE